MARELKGGQGIYPPVVKFNNAGETFVGVLSGIKDSGKFGKVFQFKAVAGTSFIGRPDGTKNEKGHNNYKSVDIKSGDLVDLGTSTNSQLEQKLLQAIVGEKIEVIFTGWKVNPKSGRSFKDYKVTVVD
jgi:hypothetical protein